MKQIITLIAATFIFTSLHATVKPYKAPIKLIEENAAMNVTLQAGGKINIMWNAVKEESTKTVYEIQKKSSGGEFKTIAILMGEKLFAYSFRDKLNGNSGTIEYRVLAFDNDVIVGTLTQDLIVL
ncbi:MAG: hypothetical protein ACSLE0_18835 [Chitinophagaceae bacterium]